VKFFICFILFFARALSANEGHVVNFRNVSALELVRFISKVSQTNFIFDEKELSFNVSLMSGTPNSTEELLSALRHVLSREGMQLIKEGNYYAIEKMSAEELLSFKRSHSLSTGTKLSALIDAEPAKEAFQVYKLQYVQGSEILDSIKGIASSTPAGAPLIKSIESIQWIKTSNSLLYTGEGVAELTSLIRSLDIQQKQVFIEILVVETSMKGGLEFGLEWAASGHYKNKLSTSFGNLNPKSPLGNAMNTPVPQTVPLSPGFSLGVIGDIILHKGLTFFSLGSLVSALQTSGDTTIVLNQKLIAQDNKSSTIFVGENIPFTGSTVQTIGASQQTTANIEYRDVGVNLKITPMVGDDDVITLDIIEEISEARDHGNQINGGILTTKTNMLTRAHIPDQHFLVLSGMVKNSKTTRKSGIPCLGSLPLIGALFSKDETRDEKRNILIFVRPQIIHSPYHHERITVEQTKKAHQEEHVRSYQ